MDTYVMIELELTGREKKKSCCDRSIDNQVSHDLLEIEKVDVNDR